MRKPISLLHLLGRLCQRAESLASGLLYAGGLGFLYLGQAVEKIQRERQALRRTSELADQARRSVTWKCYACGFVTWDGEEFEDHTEYCWTEENQQQGGGQGNGGGIIVVDAASNEPEVVSVREQRHREFVALERARNGMPYVPPTSVGSIMMSPEACRGLDTDPVIAPALDLVGSYPIAHHINVNATPNDALQVEDLEAEEEGDGSELGFPGYNPGEDALGDITDEDDDPNIVRGNS